MRKLLVVTFLGFLFSLMLASEHCARHQKRAKLLPLETLTQLN